MKLKSLLTIFCFLSFSLTVLGQVNLDTVIMKEGNVYIGKYISKDDNYLKFRIEGNVHVISINDIQKITVHFKDGKDKTTIEKEFSGFHQSSSDSITSEGKKETVTPQRAEVQNMRIRDTGYHLTRGGRFGIAGVSFLVGGSILGIVGAVEGIPALAYTGLGISGLGGIFLIVPFGQMIRAGNKYPKPEK